MIHYRIANLTLAAMTADARNRAGEFFGVEPDDPRLAVDFLGAVPARLIVGPSDMPDYPDGIPILSSGLGWVGRFDADLTDAPPPPTHLLHPIIHRVAHTDNGVVAERADGHPVPIVTACGLGVDDGILSPDVPLVMYPPHAFNAGGQATRRSILRQTGATCETCITAEHRRP